MLTFILRQDGFMVINISILATLFVSWTIPQSSMTHSHCSLTSSTSFCCDRISRAMSHKSGQPNHLSNKSKYACYSKTNSRATRANKYACYQRKTNTRALEENKYACFRVHNTLKQYEQAGYPQPKNPQGLFERSSKPLSTFLTSLLWEELYTHLSKSLLAPTRPTPAPRLQYLFTLPILGIILAVHLKGALNFEWVLHFDW